MYRQRKLKPLLKSLDIKPGGFHAFRHFNVALLDSLCCPLKVIKERLGHLSTGVFTIDVYGGKPDWKGNVEAARKAALEIEQGIENALILLLNSYFWIGIAVGGKCKCLKSKRKFGCGGLQPSERTLNSLLVRTTSESS